MTLPRQSAPIASRYRVIRELGRGGMGVVYVVEHIHTGDLLALKLLLGGGATDAKALDRFKREARASAKIKSEHVVKVVDADVAPELDGAPFLVMELLDGQDLEKLVAERGQLSPADAVDYLSQAARALDKSHAIGIVHRDLKPENLFLHRREDGTTLIKVLDFGISKLVGADAAGDMSSAGMTKTGAVLGTPIYMSPEQARGKVSLIAPATDIWAIGLMSVFLLTGEVYWRAETIADLMVQIVSDPLYPPRERWPWLPDGFDAWFARSCERDPAMRYRSAGQQIDALAGMFGVQPSALSPPSTVSSGGAVSTHKASLSGGGRVTPGSSTTNQLALGVSTANASSARRSRLPAVVGSVGLLALLGGAADLAYLRQRTVGVSAAALSAPAPPVSQPPPAVSPVAVATPVPIAASATTSAPPTSALAPVIRPRDIAHPSPPRVAPATTSEAVPSAKAATTPPPSPAKSAGTFAPVAP